MQRILGIVRKTLQDVISAIDGSIIMTPEISDAINCIFDAKVPANWLTDPSGAEISWLLPKLGGWIGSLSERNKQLNEWLKSPQRPQYFWLTGFFNPQGFLTSVAQEVTRAHKKADKGGDAWSLDDVQQTAQVKMDMKTTEGIKDSPPEGVYIFGLYLEGARMGKQGLDDSEPKKMFSELPVVHISADLKSKSKESDKGNSPYACPVYKYPRRTDKYLVTKINLQCEGTGKEKWTLRGVALLCSTD